MAKILLIDNDRDSRQLLEHALQLYDHDVVTTKRGDEGLTLAVTESPDLIVMDIDAAGLNGWQAIKVLKESSPTWLIPVIALAASNVSGHLLIQTGFDSYIKKPASARHIIKRVDMLLSKVTTGLTGTNGANGANASSSFKITTGEPTYSPSQFGQATVAYVDNNLLNSQTMEEIIEKAGYSYANVSDSLQILSQLIDLKPQLIFIESELPVVNGYELCAQIRRISIFKNTPIIIATDNHNKIAGRVRAKMAGASDFLSKPIKAKSVLKVLIKYLSSFTSA